MTKQLFRRDVNTIYELTRKQVKTQYRDSTLGFIWTILNPLLNMLVMWFVFSELFGRSDPYYPVYLLTGNILFAALRSSTTQALQSFVWNRGLLLRTKISPFVFPFSNVMTSIVNFLFSLIALIPFMIWMTVDPNIAHTLGHPVNLFSYQLVFILLMLPGFVIFEIGMGLILSTVYVFFRDMKHIYSVLLTLWTYLTPIFYKAGSLEDNKFIITVIKLNPMYQFCTYFRQCVYASAGGGNVYNGAAYTSELAVIAPVIPDFKTLGWCYLSAAIVFLIGFAIYKLAKPKIIIKI